jgi:hypothetical protein
MRRFVTRVTSRRGRGREPPFIAARNGRGSRIRAASEPCLSSRARGTRTCSAVAREDSIRSLVLRIDERVDSRTSRDSTIERRARENFYRAACCSFPRLRLLVDALLSAAGGIKSSSWRNARALPGMCAGSMIGATFWTFGASSEGEQDFLLLGGIGLLTP